LKNSAVVSDTFASDRTATLRDLKKLGGKYDETRIQKGGIDLTKVVPSDVPKYRVIHGKEKKKEGSEKVQAMIREMQEKEQKEKETRIYKLLQS